MALFYLYEYQLNNYKALILFSLHSFTNDWKEPEEDNPFWPRLKKLVFLYLYIFYL